MVLSFVTELGDRVRTLREQRGWTQAELAQRATRRGAAEVSRSWLSQVESGENGRPRADLLNQVARAMDTTIDFLMNGPPPGGQMPVYVPAEDVPFVERVKSAPLDARDIIEQLIARWHLRPEMPDDDAEKK